MSARLLILLAVAAVAAAAVSDAAPAPYARPPTPAAASALAPPPSAPPLSPPPLSADDAALLLQTLAQAPGQGFGATEFDAGDAVALLAAPEPAARLMGEMRLKTVVVAYARAQHGLRMSGRFPANWAVRPAPYNAQADLDAALAQHRLADWVKSLPPPDERYGRLVQLYARYQSIAAQGGWPLLPAKPALKPGATGDRVEALRARLAVEDPLTPTAEALIPQPPAPPAAPPAPALAPPLTPPTTAPPAAAPAPVPAKPVPPPPPPLPTYDAALAAAVSRAQARYGLTPDGVAGGATLAALNTPVERRLGQIRANLERWRWIPRPLPAYRLELNIADQSLALYDGGKPALTMRAIVGRPTKQTPMIQDHVEAVILNPPWNVPAEIAANEIWPKIRRDPGYMAREGFVVRPGGGLQQLPGPKCALGNIKFDLGNSFGVYLHDTPSRSLFARDSRTLSHGCMRLEKPNALAYRLLAYDPAWTQTRVDLTLLGGTTVRVPLHMPVPVYVLYWSAFVDDQGQAAFRTDVYHWDEKLLRWL